METGTTAPVVPAVENTTAIHVETKEENTQATGSVTAQNRALELSGARLVIERDADQGGWIYKTVDAKTGEILAQYPLRSVWEILLSRRSGLGLMVDKSI